MEKIILPGAAFSRKGGEKKKEMVPISSRLSGPKCFEGGGKKGEKEKTIADSFANLPRRVEEKGEDISPTTSIVLGEKRKKEGEKKKKGRGEKERRYISIASSNHQTPIGENQTASLFISGY